MGWMELVAAVVGTGVVSTGLTLWFGRRKADVDAEVTLSGGYGDLVKELRDERVELRTQLAASDAKAQAMFSEVIALRADFHALKADLHRVMNGEQPVGNWFT